MKDKPKTDLRNSKNEVIQLSHSGLKCDNPTCDWKDETIHPSTWPDYINAACPKCGENILTLEDYERSMLFYKVVLKIKNFHEKTWLGKFMTWISPKSKERATITYDSHNNKLEIKKNDDENGIQTPNQN